MNSDTIQRALEGAIHGIHLESDGKYERRYRQWWIFRLELIKRRIRDEYRMKMLEYQVTQLQAENAMLREDTTDGDMVFDAMLTRRVSSSERLRGKNAKLFIRRHRFFNT